MAIFSISSASTRVSATSAKRSTRRAFSCASPTRIRSVAQVRPGQAADRDTVAAAAKLYRFSRPVPGTLAETYLRGTGHHRQALSGQALRFHPACYYRPEDGGTRQSWPALLGVVTDLDGNLTGLQRTWLARDGGDKAPLPDPRRAMGHLLGNAVRFGTPNDVMAAGEGIETVLSLLSLFPALPMAAGLSAAHLAAIQFPPGLRRLYVLRDNDAAGDFAEDRLAERCREAGIDCRVLKPRGKDLNVDLRAGEAHAVKARMHRAVRAGRPLPFSVLITGGAASSARFFLRVIALASLLGKGAAPWPLRVARKPEPRAEGNGGCPFIFRRGPFGSALHREAK